MKILCANNLYTPAITYKGKPIEETKPQAPETTVPVRKAAKPDFEFSQNLSKKIDRLYTRYSNYLGETTHNDINEAVNNITTDTKYTKSEVLDAMQHLTQFANMRSIKHIGEALKKNNVYAISNGRQQVLIKGDPEITEKNEELTEAFTNDFGINSSLCYLIEAKELGKLKVNRNGKIAIFLDKNKLDLLEKVQKKYPEDFKKFSSNKDFKYFILSGFDNGISFADRTVDLETETRKLLDLSEKLNMPVDEAIDYESKMRAKKLGLEPIIIKKEGAPTTNCVYNQMAPEKMTKTDLYNIIKVNAQNRKYNIHSFSKDYIADKSVDYLDSRLLVYTPERYTKALKNLHSRITKYAEDNGKKPEDIVYILGQSAKSDKVVNYCYSRINNVPSSQFISLNKFKNDSSKLFVVLDDCSLSGDSTNCMVKHLDSWTGLNISDTLFAYICGTDYARYRTTKRENFGVMFHDTINTDKYSPFDELASVVGRSSYAEGNVTTCLVLPYMAPDNNADFAANIAMLHNPIYNTYNYPQALHEKQTGHGIKNYSGNTKEIYNEYFRNIGSKPSIESAEENI